MTAIVPHGGNVFQLKAPAAVWPANSFGKAAGFLGLMAPGDVTVPDDPVAISVRAYAEHVEPLRATLDATTVVLPNPAGAEIRVI